ncbi:MAG: LysR family transcriptional regulator [Pseudomonadota bacterium]
MTSETIDRIDLRTLLCFERVAALGSFSAASRQLDMPRAAVSRLIQKLEDQVGTKLLQRTTRSVSLTDEGQALVQDALPALSHLRTALLDTANATTELRGSVNFSVSQAFGRRFVLPALPDFLGLHPSVTVEMSVVDDLDDLVAERLDFAIRIGDMPDSSIVTRKLAEIETVLAVPSALLKTDKGPASLSELDSLPMIGFRIPGTKSLYRWHFEKKGLVQTKTPDASHLISDSIEDVAQMVTAGVGVAPLPRYLIEDQLEAGTIVVGMPSFILPSVPLHLCFPSRGKRPARVYALADHLAQHIKAAFF